MGRVRVPAVCPSLILARRRTIAVTRVSRLRNPPPPNLPTSPHGQQEQEQTPPTPPSHPGPRWTAPPRVLLVDDDEVCRRLSSKFLQVFGCSIDYAVDGMSAVSKMNAQRYDLVLMDIVMPNLDGMSATSLIRQFDQSTPIISNDVQLGTRPNS